LEQEFINILKQIAKEQGNAAFTDARKFKSLLADYTKNEYKKESRLILLAVEEGMAKAINEADDLESCKKAQIRDLDNDYSLDTDAAEDIVNTLALVLRGDTTKTMSPAEDAQSLTKKGDDAYNRRDYAEAFKCYSRAADQGYADAQNKLGNCYFNGEGAAKDFAKAAYWYTRAADQGNADAQNELGKCYSNGDGVKKDEVKAVELFRQAADQGHAKAQNNLGASYDNGEGVPNDKTKAVFWYTKSAEQGCSVAQCNLGNCYYNGQGVPKDYAKAVFWYTKAAEQGDADAQRNLHLCYEHGKGVPQDKAKAAYWFTKSMEDYKRKSKLH
jgi:TPR repeat protein